MFFEANLKAKESRKAWRTSLQESWEDLKAGLCGALVEIWTSEFLTVWLSDKAACLRICCSQSCPPPPCCSWPPPPSQSAWPSSCQERICEKVTKSSTQTTIALPLLEHQVHSSGVQVRIHHQPYALPYPAEGDGLQVDPALEEPPHGDSFGRTWFYNIIWKFDVWEKKVLW